VLIAGDAIVTMNPNSPWGFIAAKKQKVSEPPWIATWDWRKAKESVVSLAQLEPLVLAGGHGVPMSGPDTPARCGPWRIVRAPGSGEDRQRRGHRESHHGE